MFLVHTYTLKGNYFSKVDSKSAVIIYLGESGLIGKKTSAFWAPVQNGERQVNPAL